VWLSDQWGCVNGHAWNEISDWYDPDTGTRVTPYWMQPPASPEPQPMVQEVVAIPAPAPVAPAQQSANEPAPVAAPLPIYVPTAVPTVEPVSAMPVATAPPAEESRLAFLADILAAFVPYPDYQVAYGTDTDIVIDNRIASAAWGVGHKKVEYSAVMKAVESERTLYYWELIKEQGAGMTFGGMESETYSTFGAARSGKKTEVVLGAGGVAMDYDWDYGATRAIVESVAARHGWKVKVVLRKKSAQW